ncbi:malignant fibrous histiocytoma-amplified sequence 1 homolog [Watersipora subatra]|uniref:malignant fibrous histiocytoma-amplified sequence 1 homolog n=1 Tax=Watersipora subatra TaxID=2589382 RepID=UPI00355C97C1
MASAGFPIDYLKSLRKLNLSSNPIEGLSESITALSSLEELNLSRCKISQLPERYHSLQMLRDLNLAFNNIQSLPLWIYKLEKLEELDLRRNTRLEKIESAVLEMKSLVRLDCERCKNLKEPPYSVCIQGIKAIRKFFVDLAADKPVKLVEVPVAVIGNTLSGKTSLFRTLKTGKRVLTHRDRSSEQDETTRVFQVEELPLEATKIKLFDYGGNRVYHLAYQILSKEGCVPLIVVDLADFAKNVQNNGKEEACRLVCFDWLSHLYLACPKLGPPILVLTHTDELTSAQRSQARGDLLTEAESIRGKLLEEERQLETLFPKMLTVVEHLSNMNLPLFDEGEIFEFGDDLKETSNIELLKKKLNERCKEHIVELPKLWNSVERFIQQFSEQPYVEVSTVLENFPNADPLIILRYMHNAGRVFFFEKIESLSSFILHRFSEITSMINLLFHHSSQEQWDNHLSKFKVFPHHGREIGKFEYKHLVQRLLYDGVLAEALLKNLLKDSAFPFAVSRELLRSFLMIHGPIEESPNAEYLVPALALKSPGVLFKTKNKLQLRLDILLGGLSIPEYVHQQMSVTVLNLLQNHCHETSALKNGVNIVHGDSVTSVVHHLQKRLVEVNVSTSTEELSESWKCLIRVTEAIICQLFQSWKACRVTIRTYCSHCFFIGSQEPDIQDNPPWLYFQYKPDEGKPEVKVTDYSGIKPVICKKRSSAPVKVPTPLRFPCFHLTDNEIKKLKEFLSKLEHCQANFEQAQSDDEGVPPVEISTGDDESDVSDSEESYCDETSSPLISMRLVPVREKKIKDLYTNKDKVYQMSKKIRGRALILNIKTFQQSTRHDTRHGSDIDYANLEKLLKDLKVDVVKTQTELTDLSFEKILKEIQEETSREEHYRLGMFVLVIMSHGADADMLLDHHAKYFSLVAIRDSLSPRRFPAMAGKPKLIIVQACSGDRFDYGDLQEIPDSEISRTPTTVKLCVEQQSSSSTPPVPVAKGTAGLPSFVPFSDYDQPPRSARPTVLNVDDFFIMKSSCESYRSIRSTTHGSWFIRLLVATFYKHACHRDIESLFKIVQKRVRKVSMSQKNDTQGGNVPTSTCTFTHGKKLYLFPGFPSR